MKVKRRKKASSSKNIAKIICFVVLSVVLGTILLTGLDVGNYTILSIQESVNLGLDLRGGVYVVLEATEAEGGVSDETMDKAVETIRGRVDQLGVTEPIITREGDNRIRVELADVEDPEEAIQLIGQTAQLNFVDPEGNVVVTGGDIVEAQAGFAADSYGVEQPVVNFTLNAEGTEAFAAATEEFVGQIISIQLDGETISAPTVNNTIPDGEAQITGSSSIEEAQQLAILINAGALPVTLTQVQSSTVGPTLGADSLEKSMVAGAVGIIALFLFMIFFYRLPGLFAVLTLSVYMLLVMFTLINFGAVLTLQGIAGLILSVGMAVDANVIIFERIKEEIKNGKSIGASVQSGFKRAFRTILDSNVTTLIATASLYYFGSGTVRGFALTLGIGIVISMITAVLLTRFILNAVAGIKAFQKPALFGVSKGGKQ